jgi:adenylylsulfate kinase
MFAESAWRSILKAISWRILATLTTSVLVYAFTGRTDIAVTVGLLEAITKIVLYYGHERLWNRLNVGRNKITTVGNTPIASVDRSLPSTD